MYRSVLPWSLLFVTTVLLTGTTAQDAPVVNPKVIIETTQGDITIELFRSDAPVSVTNFLTYVLAGFYEGTTFHRVIREFMIQGGGFLEDNTRKTEGLRGPILNEATNNLRNQRGTVAMARSGGPNSATSQFFINTEDNGSLNHKNRTDQDYGYAVFGRVTDGMDIVRSIERTRTHSVEGVRDVPREPIIINKVRRID